MKRVILAVTAAAALAAVVLSSPAAAAPSPTPSGTFRETSRTLTFVKESGGNVYYHTQDTHSYTGTLTGTDVFDGTVIVKNDGTISWHGTSTYTGSVAGCGIGTIVFNAEGGADSLTGPAHCHQKMIGGNLPAQVNLFLDGTISSLTYGGSYSC